MKGIRNHFKNKYKLLLEFLKSINIKSSETLRIMVIFELNVKYTFMRLKSKDALLKLGEMILSLIIQLEWKT